MSNKPQQYPNKRHYNNNRRNFDDNQSQKLVITDDFRKELSKSDILVDKWYHKLLTGQYYKSNGAFFYEEPILKRLANEYQKALHMRNLDALVLIKNELYNHLPEPQWIYKYLSGEICDQSGKPLSQTNNDIVQLAKEYMEVYNRARPNTNI